MINGNALRQLRILKGMKQETMAEKLGISQPAYCKREKVKSITGEKLKQSWKHRLYKRRTENSAKNNSEVMSG